MGEKEARWYIANTTACWKARTGQVTCSLKKVSVQCQILWKPAKYPRNYYGRKKNVGLIMKTIKF